MPRDTFAPRDNKNGMMEQMQAFWLLVLDHRASLRRLDFDIFQWHIRDTATIDPFIDLRPLLDSGVNGGQDASSQRSAIEKAISQSSTGTQFLVETLESIPRLEHLRLLVRRGYGLGTLAIFPHGRFNSLQSLDLREETFSGDALPFFPKSSNLQAQTGRCKALFANTKIRSLRLCAVEEGYLAMLVQDIFPSLEYLTMDILQRYRNTSSDSQLKVIENNTLKSLTVRTERPMDRLSKVPIRWLALTTLQCRLDHLFLLDTLLQKMPRIENVMHYWSSDREVERHGGNDHSSDRGSNENREKPWHKSLRKFDSTFLIALNGQKSSLFNLLPYMSNIVCLSLGWIELAIMKKVLTATPRPFLDELRLKLTDNCSKYLAQILSSCPRLKVLKGEGVQMKARDVFRAP